MDGENGWGRANPLSSSDVAALMGNAQALNTIKGRSSFNTMCPYCKSVILTHVEYTENIEASSRVKRQCILTAIGLLLLLILFICICIIFITGVVEGLKLPSFICLFPVAFFMISLGFIVGAFHYNKDRYKDVHHSCPTCKEKLGISDGLSFLKESEYIIRTHRRIGNELTSTSF